MKRKEFIRLISAGAVCSGLAPLVQGCITYRYADATVEKDKVIVSKAAFQDDNFVLIRNPQSKSPIYLHRNSEDDVIALLMECTHKQCTVNPAGNRLSCPCHGSQFDSRGKVLKGPARKDLSRYETETSEDEIFIQLPN